MRQRKRPGREFRKKRFAPRFFVLLGFICAVLFSLGFYLYGHQEKFDDTILGSAYLEADMAIPTATPVPTPPPGFVMREPRAEMDLVSVYNRYDEKTAYLTFDDGPTTNITPQILDILKEKNVPATFFVLGMNAEKNKELISRIAAEGHAIANHSYSHDYTLLYDGTQHFVEEIKKSEQCILDAGGGAGYIKLFRFPGGSFEKKKDPHKQVLSELDYYYVDWNALSGDAERQNVPAEEQLDYIKKTTKGMYNVVILMHDASTKQTTADALPAIIDYLKGEGFTFKSLREAVAS